MKSKIIYILILFITCLTYQIKAERLLTPGDSTLTYVGCFGDGYSQVVNGTTYDENLPTGLETITGGSYTGVDSLVTIFFIFNTSSTGQENYVGQEGDGYSVDVNGTTYDEINNTGTEILTNSLGCDSTVIVDLLFNPITSGEEIYVGCEGDGYTVDVNGTTYGETPFPSFGTEIIIGGSYLGTDSVVNINLVFHPSSNSDYTETFCTGDGGTYTVGTDIYSEINPAGITTLSGANYLGCDSTVAVALTFNPSSVSDYTETFCEGSGGSYTVGADTYDELNPIGTTTLIGASQNGCDSTVNVNLSFTGLDIDITPSNPTLDCSGTGVSVVATPNNGQAGYTYQWSNGSNASTSILDIAGTYTVTITDINGCSGTETVVASDATPISISFNSSNVNCNGGADGSISVAAGGGAPPYTYEWNTTQTTATATSLSSGTYNVTITDLVGCSAELSVVITEPDPLVSNINVDQNISCNGGSDGSVSVIVAGGASQYTYMWNTLPAQTTATATSLSSGTYTVTVTDDVGCSSTASTIITEPNFLTATINVDQEPTCNNSDGLITAVGNGGTGLYTYTWSNGANSEGIIFLSSGTYTVTITDINGCTAENSISIGSSSVAGNESYTGCEGDGYDITINGVTYNETNPSGTEIIPNGSVDGCDSTVVIELEFLPETYGFEGYEGVEGDGYTISVNGVVYDEDNPLGIETLINYNGCDSIVDIQLDFYPESANVISYNGCSGDGYSVTVNGILYDESNPSGTETIVGGSYLGTDSVIVVNLVFTSGFIVNIDAALPDISCEVQEALLTANVTNGTAPLSYIWSSASNETTQSIVVTTAATYTVTVTDNAGCTNTAEVVVTENTTDSCVFPGDANYDFVVNSMDHLTVCLAGGDTGPPRNTQGINFLPYAAQDWNQQALAGVDNKHLDCDGDGTIQWADLDAVNQNYNSMHDGVNPLRIGGAPSVRLIFDEHYDIDEMNNTITGTIVLDNPDTQGDVIDLYGILFSITYDNTIIEDNSIVINYLDNSWIGNSVEVATLYKDFPTAGQMDLAFTRGDQVSISGNGIIATVQFVIEDNLIGMTSDHTLPLEVTGVYAHTNLAEPIAFNAEGDEIDISIISANHNLLSEDLINVFPNPTNDHLTIDVNDLSGISYLIYNALGQQVLNGSITNDITTINTSKLSTGIYFLNIQTEEGMINVKISVE